MQKEIQLTNIEEIALNIIKVQPRTPFKVNLGKTIKKYLIDSDGCWELTPEGERIADDVFRMLLTGDLAAEPI